MPFTVPQFQILDSGEQGGLSGALNRALQVYPEVIKAGYMPMTMQADAMSKMAYANLMGPQFLAKLMQNPDILANMSEEEKQQALAMVQAAGKGQGTGNAFLMGGNRQSPESIQFAPQSIQAAMQNMQPGQALTNTSNQPIDIDQNMTVQPQKTWAEKVAEQEGIKKQGEASGEERGKQIAGLGDQLKGLHEESGLLQQITQALQSNDIQNIRQSPVGGKYELGYYKINGTPEQKKAIGNLESLTSELATQMTQRYKGSFRPTSEMPLINQAKVNLDKDTLDAAMGKSSALNTLNQMDMERTSIASELMEDKHLSQAKAFKEADKMVNGSEIRKSVQKSLYPQPTTQDVEFMAKKYKTTPEDIINRLKKKGYRIDE